MEAVMKFFKLFSLVALAATAQNAQASDWSRLLLPHQKPVQTYIQDLPFLTPDPVYQQVFNSVDKTKMLNVLQQATGSFPVTVDGRTFSITNRYSPEAKANFRAFWKQYFTSLGIPVQELNYTTQHNIGEKEGHNLEAVLPGKSPDSVVIIVHYDSIGPWGNETNNPAVDDDMSGMVTLMETARVLAAYKGRLQNTVRFVAADYEEQANPGLEGARQYATYIKKLAADQGFKLVAAVDNEQSGWNCASDNSCGFALARGEVNTTFDVFSCSGDGAGYNFQAIGDQLTAVAAQYAPTMKVNRDCMGENSDHYAMWEIGIPSVVYSEHNPMNNPHFDAEGGDTFAKIDQDYYFRIAQVGVTFAATLAGINAQ
jgi:Zn-dependent M28 family amino/carboxypeptidase